jgi:shikimate kinase
MAMMLEKDRLVIAAGGGAVLDPDTRREMRAAGPVVWLTATVETIVARIAEDQTTIERRPNLMGDGGRAEVEVLLHQREPLYRACADVMIDADRREINGIVDEIMTAIGPRLSEGAGG